MFNPITKYMALFIAILGAIIWGLMTKLNTALSERDQATDYATQSSKQISYYKNKADEEVAKKDAVTLDYKLLQTLSKNNELQWLKQFEGLKSNLKNLEQATQVNTATIASFSTVGKDTTVQIDSVYHPAFTFENKSQYILETGTVIPELKRVDSHIEVEVPIDLVVYWQRKKFLLLRIGKKEYKTEATSPNKATKITGLDQILIKRR